MACVLHPGLETPAGGPAPAGVPSRVRPAPPAMTRCECADVSFPEVARQLAAGGSLEEATRRTGCGQTCTACLPDLRKFLATVS